MKAHSFATVLLAGISTLSLANTPIVANTGWQVDHINPGSSISQNSSWTFTLAAGDSARFMVTGCCLSPGTYWLYRDSISAANLLATSTAYAGAPTTYGSGPVEFDWQNSRYGKIDYSFSGAGSYSFLINADVWPASAGDLGVQLEVTSVPEPTTWAMMLLGLGVAGAVTRRRARAEKA